MRRCMDYIKNRLPQVSRRAYNFRGFALDTATLVNPSAVAEPVDGKAPKELRMLIVSDDLSHIRKQALMMSWVLHESGDGSGELEWDDMEDDYEDDEPWQPKYDATVRDQFLSIVAGIGYADQMAEEYGDRRESDKVKELVRNYEKDPKAEHFLSKSSSLCEIDLSGADADERAALGMFFLGKSGTASAFVDKIGIDTVLYTGLTAANIEEQIKTICCDENRFAFVAVPTELFSHPMITAMVCERGFEVVHLADDGKEHYETFYQKMVDACGIRFENEGLQGSLFGALYKTAGARISEEFIANAIDKAMGSAKDGVLSEADFKDFLSIDTNSARQKLYDKVGLANLKHATDKFLAMKHESKRNSKYSLSAGHMIYVGNPGTGKTTGAELQANIMGAEGISNGVFYVADRSMLIGSYVGHTAPKVARAFENAKGGILFVDEAGFLLHKRDGGFVMEAIKEFIRYMELYRDCVTVVFALYPDEYKDFLKLDAGLSSRIGMIVNFEDYSDEELGKIFTGMLKEKGYAAARGVEKRAVECLSDMRVRDGKRFGNAREARKLCDEAILAMAMRRQREKKTEKDDYTVRLSDINEAIRDMAAGGSEIRTFGFGGMLA